MKEISTQNIKPILIKDINIETISIDGVKPRRLPPGRLAVFYGDYNDDGILDLRVQFWRNMLSEAGVLNEEVEVLTLSAKTFNGTLVRSNATINIVPPSK